MANNKTFKGRISNKHDTSANWLIASQKGFIPLDGEIIIYDDLNRIKIGDGSTKVNDLPFLNYSEEEIQELIQTEINDLDYTDTANYKQYVSEVDETNGIIKVSRKDFPNGTSGIQKYDNGSTVQYRAALSSYITAPFSAISGGDKESQEYAVHLDGDGNLAVNVPWVDTNTTYSGDDNWILLDKNNQFYHKNDITAKTAFTHTSTTSKPGYGGTFKILDFKYDSAGHITDLQAVDVTMPSAQTLPTSFNITPNVTGDEIINVASQSAGANTFSVKLEHEAPFSDSKTAKSASTGASGYGKTSSLKIPKVSIDKFGHVTELTEETVSIALPAEQTLPTSFNINATGTGDAVIGVNASGGANSVHYSITHDEAGTVYSSENTTTSIGAGESKTIKIPQISVDKYGHTNTASDEGVTISIPAAPQVQSIAVSDDDIVNLDVSKNGTAITIIGSHKKYSDATTNSVVGKSGTITIADATSTPSINIPSLTVDQYGHVIAEEVPLNFTPINFNTDYNASDNKAATMKDISSEIGKLDVAAVSFTESETVKSISETDGKITVSKQTIKIPYANVTNWETGINEAFKERNSSAPSSYSSATGTTVNTVSSVSINDGRLSATGTAIDFNTPLSSTNKAATMSDVTKAVADLNGAMHFKGVSTTDPLGTSGATVAGVASFSAGDVVIYKYTDENQTVIAIEYVYDGAGWYKLGDESLPKKITDAAIAELKLGTITNNGNVNSATVDIITSLSQNSGVVGGSKETLNFNTAPATDNKIATMTDVTNAINALDVGGVDLTPAETINVLSEANGKISVSKQAIAITHNQITDFDDGVKEIIDEYDWTGIDLAPSETINIIKQEDGLVNATKQNIAITSSQVTDFNSAVGGLIPNISVTTNDDGVAKASASATGHSLTINTSHAEVGSAITSTANSGSVSGYGASKTLSIPRVSTDKWGHVTSIANDSVTITMPSVSDTKVTTTLTSTSGEYPILIKNTTTATDSPTTTARYGAGITVNPSTKTITATTFKGSLDGNANTADMAEAVQGTLKIQANGTDKISYNGSIGSTLNIATGSANGTISVGGTNVSVKGLGDNAYTSTPHLPLTGGTVTGNITFNAGASSQAGEPKLIWKTIGGNTPYTGFAEDQSDGTFVILSMEQSAEVTTNGAKNYKNGLAIGGGSGSLFWKGSKIATILDIPTSLKNPNSLTIQSNGTTLDSYDGSSAKTINIPASTVTLNGTSTTSASFYAPTTGGTSGYYLKSNGTSAPTWAALPADTNTTNVVAGNGLTGGGSANSSTGVTLNVGAGTGISVAADTVSLATSGVTAGTYGPSAAVTGSNGATMNVPQITVDAYGRVTSITNRVYTAQNTANTDTKVKQTAYSTSANLPILTCTTASPTSGSAYETYYDTGVYINHNTKALTATKVYGAVWNDYAEYRNQIEEIKPGYCVASSDDGKVYKTTEKFQACDGIVSDTFGFGIGETDDCKTPLAVAGRVLAYAENPEELHSGDTVCAGPNGKVVKMTREEVREWPDRILGIVSEIPTYETWGTGNVKVDGRIWLKVK